MSTSNALVVIDKKPKPEAEDAKAEKFGSATEKITLPVEVLHLHSALILAAVSTIDAKPAVPMLGGIRLHRRGASGRLVGSDGQRMFLASFPLPDPAPSWLKDGITIAADGLLKRVQLLMAGSDTGAIKIAHTKGNGFVQVSDDTDDAVFKVSIVPGPYLDYEKVVGSAWLTGVDADGNLIERAWEPIGINSAYLKHCGEIAKKLEAGLPKSKRSANGMIIRAYNSGKVTDPLVFDFASWPGAVLAMLPARLADNSASRETAALMAPALKLTVAALRAHATRQLAWSEAATDPRVKADHAAKAQGFVERVAEILTRTHGQPVIGSEKPEPKAAKPEAKPVEAAAEPAEPAADKPAAAGEGGGGGGAEVETRRTPVKVRRNKAA